MKHGAVPFDRGRRVAGTAAARGWAVLGELRVALGYLVSIVAFLVEEIPMRRFLRHLVVGSAVVFLGPLAHAWGQNDSKLEPAPSGFADRRDSIERGKVETVEYDSKSVGDTRKMTVYLPPGYSKDTKYPVFYLLHGAGDNEEGWTRTGAANLILDNLFADKKIVPMIVVMPNGSNQGPRPGTVLAGTIMKRADADKNGIMSREEFLAAAEALFKDLDTGKLDEKQLAAGLNRLMPAPALRVAVAAGSATSSVAFKTTC